MSTLGQIFREARERKGASTSQAAAATRMKVQHVEAIEQDRFDRIPAPAYARGFIRMYAEYLGLAAAPLVARYNEEHGPSRVVAPPPETDAPPRCPRRAESPAETLSREAGTTPPPGLLDRMTGWVGTSAAWLSHVPWRVVLPVGVALFVVLWAVRWVVSRPPPAPEPSVVVEPVTRVEVPAGVPTRISQEPDFHLRPRTPVNPRTP